MSVMARRPPLAAFRRWAAVPGHLAVLIVATALVGVACTSTGVSASPSASTGVASPSPAASPTPSASAKPSPSPRINQTETPWGRIWDAVPASFPVPPGALPATADYAASAAWSIASGDPVAVTDALKAGLENAGYTTGTVDGPLEDGSRIIDSAGKPDACRIQTRVRPLGTTVNVTVLFGAACPFR